MNRLIATAEQFSFPARELPQQLLEYIQDDKVGYWEHQFERLAGREQILSWNLGIANGQILYSGNRLWSIQSLMRVIYRYGIHTRNDLVRQKFEQLKAQAEEQSLHPAELLAQMKKIGIINDSQLLKALKLKVLNDLDIYLMMGGGNAKFIIDRDLEIQLPVEGFSPMILLDEAKQRQLLWEKLQPQVPSMTIIGAGVFFFGGWKLIKPTLANLANISAISRVSLAISSAIELRVS